MLSAIQSSLNQSMMHKQDRTHPITFSVQSFSVVRAQ